MTVTYYLSYRYTTADGASVVTGTVAQLARPLNTAEDIATLTINLTDDNHRDVVVLGFAPLAGPAESRTRP
jgi:hypothetical protein